MLFSATKLLLGAACLLFGAAQAQDDCGEGPWQDVSYTGGDGGGRFCATKWKAGVVVTGVEVWADKGSVRAVQFYYSDGTNSQQWGKVDGDKHARLDWDPAVDGISQIKTWGNGRAQYLGRVFIRTKKGAELDVGKDTSGQDTFETNVASGIMLGAFGSCGDRIDNMGFLFLKSKIEKITIDDVVFSETPEMLNARMEGLETVILDYADHTNANTAATETFTFGKTDTKSTTKSFSNTATNSFGWSTATELSGKILDLGASSTTTLKYDYSKATTEESSTTNTVMLTYSVATVLAPGQRTFCRATAMSGTYKGDYTSTVNIWLEDGTTFGFEQEGTMEQVNWSKASSVCQDNDFPPEKRAVKFIS
ncbi:hypothetical protein K505DRAFT_418383 [Melanomma pulvis-pyrius CBS 109.77]|uniref:Jacalin-type lectin domain-containing protein n=1 Tax=Melanomma pulvis-pyrius CBS 109.77 TaxID=1314802 RepID=A0A6A6X9W8_9PLEO|nr:hypothetical protein K505DRAFT_418383 [Melanomma pulvis-pyrius CBS 109.77]